MAGRPPLTWLCIESQGVGVGGGIRWAQAAVTRNPNNLTPHSLARAQDQPHDTLQQTSFSLLIQTGAPTGQHLLFIV